MARRSGVQPRVVVVARPSEYAQLLARHGTHAQAAFFLETRGQQIDAVRARHELQEQALARVLRAVPVQWRRARIDRVDLDRFLFEPGDIVVAVGQDGLVANTAKYLRGQTVIGINPDPSRNEGILVPHPPQAIGDLIAVAYDGSGRIQRRTMARARTDDGQTLLALNELFLGHASHQSARYRIAYDGQEELHSSSGVVVTTGTGATGWSRSIRRNRVCDLTLPQPEDPTLAFFVREAWPSVHTGVDVSEGLVPGGQHLELTSRMDNGGVIFGDGIEADRIEFGWGRKVEVGVADAKLHLLVG